MVLKSKDLALQAARACADKKADDIEILDLTRVSMMTDYFVICSAGSQQQIRAIARAVEDAVADLDLAIRRREGNDESQWVLMDLGDVVVHIFQQSQRSHYDLERLWGDAPRLDFDLNEPGANRLL